jgi:PAS domain S-box-containing protein
MREYPQEQKLRANLPAILLLILACLAAAWSFAVASLFGFSDRSSKRFEIVSATAIVLAAGLILVAFFKVAKRLRYLGEPSEVKEYYQALTELSSQIIWMADKDGKVTYFNQRWYDYTGFRPEDSLGNGWAEVLHLDHREICAAIWKDTVRAAVPYENEYLFRRFDGVYRWHVGRGLPLKDEKGRTVSWFGTCTDIHDQRIAAAATARIAERLGLAMEAGETGTFEVYPYTGESIWSDQCRAILGVPKTSEAGIESMMQVVHPIDRHRLKDFMQLMRSDEAPSRIDIEFRVLRPEGELHWIAAKGRSSQDIELANSGRRIIGVVTDITIRKLAEQERLAFTAHIEEAREEERTHVAREIHDELGQVLTGVKLDVAWINTRVRALDSLADVRERADATLALLDRSIQTVRRISTELRPGVLDDLGLSAAIEWLARTFEQHSGFSPSLRIEIDDSCLPKNYQTALFRISQEALTNVARHAEASEVAVSLTYYDGSIKLIISDNGCGFTPHTTKGGSFGVIGMRERISNLGGQFRIASSDGHGTTISVILPLSGAAV